MNWMIRVKEGKRGVCVTSNFSIVIQSAYMWKFEKNLRYDLNSMSNKNVDI